MRRRSKTHDIINPASCIQKPGEPKREPCRGTDEVAAMFGFNNKRGLHASIKSKCFPEPDFVGGINRSRLFWRLSTLNAELKRRQSKKLEK